MNQEGDIWKSIHGAAAGAADDVDVDVDVDVDDDVDDDVDVDDVDFETFALLG